jgi:tetrahydromethanopterin S-methyltransferase subunit C
VRHVPARFLERGGKELAPLALPPAIAQASADELGRWIESAAGLETAVPDVGQMLLGAGPAAFCLRTVESMFFVPILRARLAICW